MRPVRDQGPISGAPSGDHRRAVADRISVAVIDDDPSVCRALRRLLMSADMDVETHLSGKSFLEANSRREPDCLILDITMPGMSGPELRDRLRASGRRIPVVFITAHAQDENGLAGGTTEILRKPFGDQALLEAIRRAIQNGASS